MHRFYVSTVILVALAACSREQQAEDPYLWLEDVEGERALAWVEQQNTASLGYLEALPTFEPMARRNLEIYDSDERIAMPNLMGDYVYNYWRDAGNKRGLWRRTSLDEYVAGDADWEIVLDLDALATAEDEDWVWKGASCLRPEYRKCLLRLSRGGADAVVVREFDTATREFVEDGFFVAEFKTRVSWIDADTVFIGSDFGPGSLTDSGYPRTARLWNRGDPIAEAKEVFAGEKQDVAVTVYREWDGDSAYDVVHRTPTFFTAERFMYAADGNHKKIDIPDDATFYGLMNGQMLLEIKSSWKPADIEYIQGTLMSIDFDAFMGGSREFNVIFVPTAHSAIKSDSILNTRDYLIVNILEDVTGKLMRFEFIDGEWLGIDIETEALGSISLIAASEDSNVFFFNYEGFLRPDTLFVANDGGATTAALFSLPDYFDTDGMSVEQRFVMSKDGTQIPYFLVTPKNFVADGNAPTLLYGYGGFEISITPTYSATVGHAWLERGGVYAVANIRGGGEYGPRWHQAALKDKRQNAYDDMIAIAEDLIASGVTSAEHLGVRGGSNGGLLTGVMLTQRPDLWGAIVVQVPLLDMKRFNHLLAGASWMGEYGNPDTDDWDYISQYSPYHNIREDVNYPKAFFATSTRDDRVHPAHARKMVARLSEMGHDLYYYENTVGGHAGASDNTQVAKLQSLIYSYLWDQLGSE